MTNLILVFICVLPFSNFLFRGVDIWHATGHFVQLGILVIFSYSFFVKAKYTSVLNKPLGSFICWAGVVTGYQWVKILEVGHHYPIKLFMPFFNLLCLVILYKIIVEYLDEDSIRKILRCFKYSIIVLLLYCVLQQYDLDEFFRSTDIVVPDKLVGTIGNPSHLAGLLAIVQPLFFSKGLLDILCLILLWGVIILTGSASGIVAGVVVLLFWLLNNSKKWFIVASITALGAGVCGFIKYHSFFNPYGRIDIWTKAIEILKKKPITGAGLGSFGSLNLMNPDHWQHLHCEPYQTALEIGIIGFILGVWCILDYFQVFLSIRKSPVSVKLTGMMIGFFLVSLVSFPGHLWLISTIVMFSYASLYALKNEVIND